MFSLNPHSFRNNKNTKNIKNPIPKIITKKFISEQSHAVQFALNTNKIVDENFRIKRAKPKININKNKNESPLIFSKTFRRILKNESPTKNKENIASELADILDSNEFKFSKISEYYNEIKENNDNFLNYWEYIKQSRGLNEKSLKKNKSCLSFAAVMENFCKKNNISEEKYKSLNNEYNSARDEFEFDMQKKTIKNIFKANPLVLTNEKDMIFYFLSKGHGNKTKLSEDNPTKFLLKLKDFIDFLKIYKNKGNTNTDKEKLSSDYYNKYAKLLEEEQINNLNKEISEEIKKIEEAKKMIKETKLSLNKLKNNKNYFEDPNYFTKTFSDNRSKTQIKFYTFYKNNKKDDLYKTKLNDTSVTTYFQDRINNNSKNSYQISNYSKIKNTSKIQKNENKYKNNTKYQNFRKIISSFCENSKNNSNILVKNYTRNSFNTNKTSNMLLSTKSLETKRQSKNENSDNTERPFPQISSNVISPLPKSSTVFQSFKDEISSIKKSSPLIIFENLKAKKIKIPKQPKIYEIYNKIKSDGEISENNYRKISNYYKGKDIGKKSKKNTVEIIRDTKLISDDFDINKVTCPLFEEQQVKLINQFQRTNSELYNLEKNYIKSICQYKAKYKRNEV